MNNFQPRAGFSWDLKGDGRHVVRGGVGMFTGRFLLVPAHIETQQNGYTGRIIQQRINGAVLGLPAFALDPNNPTTTGIPLTRDSGRIDNSFVNPYSTQVTAGYSFRLGSKRPRGGLRGHLRQGRRRDHHPRQELAGEQRRRVQRRGRGVPAEQDASTRSTSTRTRGGRSTRRSSAA